MDILAKHAAGRGLDAAAPRSALAQGTYREEVLADEDLARDLRANGVPAITVGAANDPIEQAVIIEGARPYETVRKIVERFVRLNANE